VTVRPIRREDETDLARFFIVSITQSRVFRFSRQVANFDPKRMVDVDYASRYGILALAGPQLAIHMGRG